MQTPGLAKVYPLELSILSHLTLLGMPCVQEQGAEEIGEQYDDWVKHRELPLMMLVHDLLGERTKTHVVEILLDYQPTKNPVFQVGWEGVHWWPACGWTARTCGRC
jgi:hypothetical protein